MEAASGTQDHRVTRLPHERKAEGGEEEVGGGSYSLLVPELIGQPVQSFIEPIPAGGTGCLNVPVPVA